MGQRDITNIRQMITITVFYSHRLECQGNRALKSDHNMQLTHPISLITLMIITLQCVRFFVCRFDFDHIKRL